MSKNTSKNASKVTTSTTAPETAPLTAGTAESAPLTAGTAESAPALTTVPENPAPVRKERVNFDALALRVAFMSPAEGVAHCKASGLDHKGALALVARLRAIAAPGPVALADALTVAYPAPVGGGKIPPALGEGREYMVQSGLQAGSAIPAPWARVPLARAALIAAGFEFAPRSAMCTMRRRDGGGVIITMEIMPHMVDRNVPLNPASK